MPSPPNIALIFPDGFQSNAIDALGHPDVITPHLDRLVRNGTTLIPPVIGTRIWTSQLFDLENDLREISNIAGCPRYHERVTSMRNEMRRWQTELNDTGAWHEPQERTIDKHGNVRRPFCFFCVTGCDERPSAGHQSE